MSANKRRLAAIAIAAITLVTPVTVSAKYTYDDAIREFADTLELIDSTYLDSEKLDYKQMLDQALLAVFDELDEYSEYMTRQEYEGFMSYAETNKAGIGVSIIKTGGGYAEVTKVYRDSPAERAGFISGDIIVTIEGKDIKGKTLLEIRDMIIGVAGTRSVVVVNRNGELIPLTAVRGSFSVPLAERLQISEFLPGADDKKTAYVEISSFVSNDTSPANDTAKQFEKIYEGLKREKVENLIIDLRDNTGGDVQAVIDMSQLLAKEGVLFTFRYNSGSFDTFRSTKKDTDFNVAVLVNESTASSAEVLASVIKESGSGIIVGSNTFGKGVGQLPIPASDGQHVIKLTVTEIITRNGNKLNGVGVIPDIYIEPPPWLMVTEPINEGSGKEDVEALKKAMGYLGYGSASDSGRYDEEIKNMIRRFQADAGLTPDGVCSEAVIIKINDYVADKYRGRDYALEKAYEALNKHS